MLKKFLGIFKRDKSGFSAEELRWQAKIGRTVTKILGGIMYGSISFFMGFQLYNFFEFFFENIVNKCIATIIGMILLIGIIVIIMFIIEVILNLSRKVFQCEKINNQLQQKLKQKEKEKILSCLEKRNFLELGIDWPMINRFFQLLLIHGIIEMIPSSDGVEVSVSKDIQDISSFFISRDELLDYFDVDNDEEK